MASVLVSGAGWPPEQEEGEGGGARRPQGSAGESGRLSGALRQGHVVGPSLQTDPPQEPSRAAACGGVRAFRGQPWRLLPSWRPEREALLCGHTSPGPTF